ncbi:MAG: hypothetical protein Q7S83_00865 [bacterium]|nr:hypothetical protein [bacterium]
MHNRKFPFVGEFSIIKEMEGEALPAQRKPTLITAIIILAVVIAAVAGYFVWRNSSTTPEERAFNALDQAAQTGTLPIIDPSGNPAESLPTVNPVDQINPFGKTYKNPF